MSGGTYTAGDGGKDGPMQIDDETLMALADGELDPARAEELRRAIAADPELQSRLHRFQETRRLLSGLRADPKGEDPLAAMIRRSATAAPTRIVPSPTASHAAGPRPVLPSGGTPLTAPARAPRRPANLNRRPWLAAAASAAIVAIGLGWWEWADAPAPRDFSPAELAALDALPSGQVQASDDGGELAMIASFRGLDGTLCREYETAQRAVLACREAAGWTLRHAAVPETAGRDYRPASGQGSMDDAIAAIGATAPLTPEEEAAALRE